MKNPFAFLKKKGGPGHNGPPARSRPAMKMRPEQALARGLAGLAVLLALVLGWDAYLLTQSLYPESAPAETTIPVSTKTFSADLDEAIKILDEREQTLQKILESVATGTPLQ